MKTATSAVARPHQVKEHCKPGGHVAQAVLGGAPVNSQHRRTNNRVIIRPGRSDEADFQSSACREVETPRSSGRSAGSKSAHPACRGRPQDGSSGPGVRRAQISRSSRKDKLNRSRPKRAPAGSICRSLSKVPDSLLPSTSITKSALHATAGGPPRSAQGRSTDRLA